MPPKKNSGAAASPQVLKVQRARITKLSALSNDPKSPEMPASAQAVGRNAKLRSHNKHVAESTGVVKKKRTTGPKNIVIAQSTNDTAELASGSNLAEDFESHYVHAPPRSKAKAVGEHVHSTTEQKPFGLISPGKGTEYCGSRKREHEDDDTQPYESTSLRTFKRQAADTGCSVVDTVDGENVHTMRLRTNARVEYQRDGVFRFTALPQELRDEVQRHALGHTRKIVLNAPPRTGAFAMLDVSMQMRTECKDAMQRRAKDDPSSVVVEITDFDFSDAIGSVQSYLGPGVSEKSVPSDGMLPKVIVKLNIINDISAKDKSLRTRIKEWFQFLAKFEETSTFNVIEEECGYEMGDCQEPEVALNHVRKVTKDMKDARQCQILKSFLETWLNKRDDNIDRTSSTIGFLEVESDYDSQDDEDYDPDDENDPSIMIIDGRKDDEDDEGDWEDMSDDDVEADSEEPSLESLADLDEGVPQNKEDYLYHRAHDMHLQDAIRNGFVKQE